jgi:hypothetical protein
VANNCDYCHKPLSLMRRLRGEQFCSLEHMNLFAAQQAEFALERLAASVTEKPNTERPPAIARPKLRPKAAPNGDRVATPSTLADPSGPASQTAVALQEREHHAIHEVPRRTDTEYPMAAHVAQEPVEPRTSESGVRKGADFAPVEHWGKVAPAWSMPPFHSEPGDPRTWNAGKLVSQIPPVAGWRELMSPMDVGPVESATDADAQLPSLTVSVEQIAALPALTELRNEIPARLTQFKALNLQRGTIEIALRAEYPVNFPWAGPLLAPVTDAVENAFRMAENRLDPAALWSNVSHAHTLTLDWNEIGGPQFTPHQPVQGGMAPASAAVNSLDKAGLQRHPWNAKPQVATLLAQDKTTMGPAMPEAAYALPHPAPWNWTESFTIPAVALPEFLPMPLSPAKGLGADSWQELRGTLRNPAIQWIAPHLGYYGPSFGWESIAPKTSASPDGAGLEPAYFADIDTLKLGPRVLEFHARVRAALTAPGPCALLGWSTPKIDTARLEVGPLVNLRPTVTAMAIQVRPLLPFRAAHLQSVHGAASTLAPSRGAGPVLQTNDAAPNISLAASRIGVPGPVPWLRCPTVTLRTAKATIAENITISHAGPVKYSPVAIVVVPTPQFALLPAVLADEQRYVAQTPNGVWRLPRVRHTGYRSLGPFPKLPLRMPDRYLRAVPSKVPPAFGEVPLHPIGVQQDLSGIPSFASPRASRVHPADYFAWPEPKGLKSTRMWPEREQLPAPSEQAVARRFGPGRAGLQSRNKSADGLGRGTA